MEIIIKTISNGRDFEALKNEAKGKLYAGFLERSGTFFIPDQNGSPTKITREALLEKFKLTEYQLAALIRGDEAPSVILENSTTEPEVETKAVETPEAEVTVPEAEVEAPVAEAQTSAEVKKPEKVEYEVKVGVIESTEVETKEESTPELDEAEIEAAEEAAEAEAETAVLKILEAILKSHPEVPNVGWKELIALTYQQNARIEKLLALILRII